MRQLERIWNARFFYLVVLSSRATRGIAHWGTITHSSFENSLEFQFAPIVAVQHRWNSTLNLDPVQRHHHVFAFQPCLDSIDKHFVGVEQDSPLEYKRVSPAVEPCFTRPKVSVRRPTTVSLPLCPVQILRPAYLRLSRDFVLIADRKAEAVMRRFSLFFAAVLCLAAAARAQTTESIVPAGTLFQCTLNEPRFSSETVQVGEPVLCNIGSLAMFGRPVFSARRVSLGSFGGIPRSWTFRWQRLAQA